jgi:murein DD-endopeptidase MepM/ murein hydrolase activator NlpD
VTAALLAALLLASPPASIAPGRARPGDAVLVTVLDQAPPQGSLLGRPLRFFAAGPGRWQALAALPMEAPLGPAALLLAGAPAEATLQVMPPSFRSTALDVPPRFLEPPASARPRLAADAAALNRAYAQPFEPPLFATPLLRPRDAEVSSGYGDQRVYNGKTSGVHYGLDLVGRTGDPIAASAEGRVVLARDCYLSGWTTVVWHGAGVFTVYLHQSKVEVKAGQRVGRGQRIGRVGSTGRSTGPHLHWGVKLDGLWVDPESMLRLDLDAPAAGGQPVAAGPAGPPAPARPAPPAPP